MYQSGKQENSSRTGRPHSTVPQPSRPGDTLDDPFHGMDFFEVTAEQFVSREEHG